MLWLNVVLPPIIDGRLYPEGLAHFTTMVVQGFDLALFLPPSLLAGYTYLVGKPAVGVNGGPALVIIPLLLAGAVTAAYVALKPYARVRAQ